ncbi:MAG: hypothetical protein ACYDHF_02940 [Candidatus Cryosericum sp.]
MIDDTRTTQVVKAGDERPFDLPEELKAELNALFAPMDRSVAASVVSTVEAHSRRRRSLQALWLGLSPAVALALVAVLYVSGMSVLTVSPSAAPQGMVAASNPDTRASDLVGKGLTAPGNLATLAARCSGPALRVDLQRDLVRRGVLASWLRAGHPDVAAQLETLRTGATVSLVLNASETRGFVSLMILHGFVGQAPSGLVLSTQSSLEAWMSALRAASSAVCFSL